MIDPESYLSMDGVHHLHNWMLTPILPDLSKIRRETPGPDNPACENNLGRAIEGRDGPNKTTRDEGTYPMRIEIEKQEEWGSAPPRQEESEEGKAHKVYLGACQKS